MRDSRIPWESERIRKKLLASRFRLKNPDRGKQHVVNRARSASVATQIIFHSGDVEIVLDRNRVNSTLFARTLCTNGDTRLEDWRTMQPRLMAADSHTVNVIIGVELLVGILDRHSVHEWNGLIEELVELNALCPVWREGEEPPSLVVNIVLSEADFSFRNLDSIDLRFSSLDSANFSGTSLQRARFDCADISGCDFSDALLDEASFDGAWYEPDRRPIGLPLLLALSSRP